MHSSVSAERDAERIRSGSPERAGKFERLIVRSSSINIPEILRISFMGKCAGFGIENVERSSNVAVLFSSIPRQRN